MTREIYGFQGTLPFGKPLALSASEDRWFNWFRGRFAMKDYRSWTDFKEKHLFSVMEMQLQELENRGCEFILIARGSKMPLIGTTWKNKSASMDQIMAWIRKKGGNLAVVSKRSNIFVVDLDPEPAFINGEYRFLSPTSRKHITKLSKATTYWLPFLKETFCVKTPRGIHLWFKASGISRDLEERLDKLNVRSDIFRKGNQYELIPPSVITQEQIDITNRKRKDLGQNPVNWKEGSYDYVNFEKPFLPLEKALS